MNLTDKNVFEQNGLVHTVDTMPLPNSIGDIITIISRVIRKGFVQSISLDINEGITIDWYRAITDTLEVSEPEDSVEVVLSRIELDELNQDFFSNIYEDFINALNDISEKGFVPSFIVTNSIANLKNILGNINLVKDYANKNFKYCDMPILITDIVLDGYIIICGSITKNNNKNEIVYGIKLNNRSK